MVRLWLAIGCAAVVLLATGLISSTARSQPRVDPAAVITAYETARNQQDIETALSYFADNATITQRNATFSGKDEIRKYLDTVANRARYIVVSDRHTTGNIVSWTERSGTQVLQPTLRQLPAPTVGQQPSTGATGLYGRSSPTQTTGASSGVAVANTFAVTVEAVVQDGKIQSLSYVFAGQPGRVDPALDGRAQLPASIGLAAVAALVLGLIAVAWVGLGRAAPVPSSLQGRLMQDLQGWAAARD